VSKPKAKWTTRPNELMTQVGQDGTFTAAIPLYDAGTKAATLTFTITADRVLTVLCENEPGSAGLTGFTAWSKEA
jgi:hypothetical protein